MSSFNLAPSADDHRLFDAAFAEVSAEIEAPAAAKEALHRRLSRAFARGVPQDGDKAAAEFFASGYAWPRYLDYLRDRRLERAEAVAERARAIRQTGAVDLLASLTVDGLLDIAARHAIAVKRRRKKTDMVAALAEGLRGAGALNGVVNAIRLQALERLRNEFAPDPKEAGMLFHHRVTMMACGRRNRAQALRNSDLFGFWLFSSVDDDRTPADCRALNGTVRRFDDRFWSDHPIPCGRLFCRCTIITLNERQASRQCDKVPRSG